MDDWSDLDVFYAVAEEGSLAAAARRLRLSHPTVGRRLDALERRLGAQLIHRGAGGADLTAFGVAVQDNVRRMGREAEAIRRLADGDEPGLAGVVAISALDGIGVTIVPRILGELRAHHPDLTFNVDISTRTVNLARREADIALRYGGPGEQSSLIGRRVLSIGMGLYAAPAYLDAHGRPQTIADLAQHDLVTHVFHEGEEWSPEIAGEPLQWRRLAFSSGNLTAQQSATEAGMGIGTHSHWRARGHAKLERVLPDIALKPIEVWLVTHADMKRSARIRLVYDHLVERLLANAAYFRDGDPDVPERFD